MRPNLVGLIVLSMVAAVNVGCPSFVGNCDDSVCFGDAADAPVDSPIDAPPGCVPGADPKDSPECVVDSFGVFVDATSGKDANIGTKTSPVQTIAHALDVAKQKSLPRLYVCEGSYAEDVTLDSTHDGTSIYGGWKCADWSYSGNKPVLGKTQLALKIATTKAVTIEDLEVDGAAGDTTTLSSIAALVASTNKVSFTRVRLVAAAGHDGANGALGSNYNTSLLPSDPAIAGKAAMMSSGGGNNTCSTLCTTAAITSGGAGGSGGLSTQSGSDGTPNLSGTFPTDGKGGSKDTGTSCTSGDKGANGGAGTPAVTPSATGTLDASGWKPSSGNAGGIGGIAQGGGGGGGGLDVANSGGGGGGGCGGCGGAPGAGGGGGGGSIALAVASGNVTLVSSQLVAVNAGNGGAGTAGQVGQTGGNKGGQVGNGCLGGQGGTGGTGGSGAGGVGGISVGVLWVGAQPTLDGATTSAITVAAKGGTKGIGGSSGVNDGIDGVAQSVLQAP